MEGYSVKNKLGLVGFLRIDNDHAVIQRAREDVSAFVKNRDGTADNLHSIVIAYGGSAA